MVRTPLLTRKRRIKISTMKQIILFHQNGETLEVKYELIRSRRKTVGFEVKPGGKIFIKIPNRMSLSLLPPMIEEKKQWLFEAYQNQKDKEDLSLARQLEKSDPRLSYLEKKYRQAAKQYIYERVEYYLPLIGGHYSSIRIGDQKTRWGSCSSNKTLSFSWRLMLAPPRVLDYVVIHELCHLTHMDHSKDFWALVASVDPDYKEHRQWLKENGDKLLLK